MVSVVDGFRWALLGSGTPPDRFLAYGFLAAIPLLISGAYVYRRAERSIVDIA